MVLQPPAAEGERAGQAASSTLLQGLQKLELVPIKISTSSLTDPIKKKKNCHSVIGWGKAVKHYGNGRFK